MTKDSNLLVFQGHILINREREIQRMIQMSRGSEAFASIECLLYQKKKRCGKLQKNCNVCYLFLVSSFSISSLSFFPCVCVCVKFHRCITYCLVCIVSRSLVSHCFFCSFRRERKKTVPKYF